MPLGIGEGGVFGGDKTILGTLNASRGLIGRPSLNFGDPTSGFFRQALNTISLVAAGTEIVRFNPPSSPQTMWFNTYNNFGAGAVAFASSGGGTIDAALKREAANVVAFKGFSNSQRTHTITIYNLHTDDTNYERLFVGHASNVAIITPEALGTGTLRGMRLGATGTSIGFLGATPIAQQTSGADLTNNVTAGGTDDTIADFTSLTVYATDAAAIRNDIYQLARKVKQLNDALRDYGLFT